MCAEEQVQEILETIRDVHPVSDGDAAYIEAKLRELFDVES